MKFIRRTILILLILTIVGLLFRGWFYRQLVTYKSVGLRTTYIATNPRLIDYINARLDKKVSLSIEQIIKLSLSLTSKQLYFTADKNDIDPNKLVSSRAAHCVGYASFYTTTCNYLLKKYGLDETWIVKLQIGQLYLFGTNIHKFFNSPFFKDHDFVTIENNRTGEIFTVDPTVNDYLWIDFVTFTK